MIGLLKLGLCFLMIITGIVGAVVGITLIVAITFLGEARLRVVRSLLLILLLSVTLSVIFLVMDTGLLMRVSESCLLKQSTTSLTLGIPSPS